MSKGKKVLNVFGIIFAWILSIVLIISLIATPIVFSSLSLIKPEILTDAITSVDITEFIPVGSIEDIMPEGTSELLKTDAAKELVELYATDITNSLGGKEIESKFTPEAFQGIVDENIDEIVAVMKKHGVEMPDVPEEEIKQTVQSAITENVDKIMEKLPDPKEIIAQVTTGNPELQGTFDIVGRVNSIKPTIIGAMVIVALLIFLCRLFDFKGVRWLSIDLFIASGFLVIVCVALLIGSSAINAFLGAEGLIGGILGGFINEFTKGMVIRTAVILVVATVLIVAYVLIKKSLAKRKKDIDTDSMISLEAAIGENLE